jgi:hypothetical protein
MRKFFIIQQKPLAKYNNIAPIIHQRVDQISYNQGEDQMSKQEEYQIYRRLAQEIIKSRLGVKPTEGRVDCLAKMMQSIDNEEDVT